VRHYLDYNATAPLRPQVREAVIQAMDLVGNASSIHAEGRKARAAIERARLQVAQLVNGDPGCVIFMSGATEANMQALTPNMKWDYETKSASHLYYSAVEHPSVLAGGRFAESQMTSIPVDENGVVDLVELRGLLEQHDGSHGVAMVAIMAVNSETGVIQPIEEIAKLAKEFDAYCHIDAVQAAGRIPLDIGQVGCTSMSLSSHKLGGPKGIGALVMAREGLEPEQLITGGPQENRNRAGTEDVQAIVGFGIAAELAFEQAQDTSNDSEMARLRGLRDRFEAGLRDLVPDVVIFGEGAARIDNCSQFAIPGMRAETMLIQLDLAGVAVSSGSACSSGKISASHVLIAMGVDAVLAGAAVRVSLGWASTTEDVEKLLSVLAKICAKHSKKLSLAL